MRRIFLVLVFSLMLMPAALPALAVDPPAPVVTEAPAAPTRTVKLVNPLDKCPPDAGPNDPCHTTIPELIGNIIKAAVGVVGAFALLIFVYGGFLLLTSSGETAKIQAGKDAMKWSVIGLAVVFSSYALVSFVLSSLGQQVK